MTSHALPSPEFTIKKGYYDMLDQLEKQMRGLVEKHFRNRLQCKPGCSECCLQFSVLPLEAAIMEECMRREAVAPVENHHDSCPLLHEKLCAVYEARPIICRTQGMPIGYVDEENKSIEVSACPLNFAEDYQFSQEELLMLDTFNALLSQLNLEYCRAAGIEPYRRIRITNITGDPPS